MAYLRVLGGLFFRIVLVKIIQWKVIKKFYNFFCEKMILIVYIYENYFYNIYSTGGKHD